MVILNILSVFAGALYASGFPILGTTYYFFPGPILGLTLFGIVITKASKLSSQILLWLSLSLGFYGLGFNWIPYTLYEFGSVPSPINQIIGVLSSVILLPPVLIFIFAMNLGRKLIPKKMHQLLSGPVMLSFIGTTLFQVVPSQFPAFPGHSWLALSPYLGLGKIFGEQIFTFISLFSCFHFLRIIKNKKVEKNFPITVGVFLALNLIIPLGDVGFKEKVSVRIIQANIGNDSKTASENGDVKSIFEIFDKYHELSLRPSKTKLDLIIWPETAYPYNINSHKIKSNPYFTPGLIKEIIASTKASLLFGVRDAPTEDTLYNSAMLIDTNLKSDIYYKNKLLPFGEDIPLGSLTPHVRPYFPGIAFFDKGKTTTVFNLPNEAKFSSIICYEVLFPTLIFNQLTEEDLFPDFFVNITNDSWYGNTSEPEQHLFLSRWRPIEFGIPLIRSTNTGISTVIYTNGNTSKRLEYGTEGNLDVFVPIGQGNRTPFSQYGHAPFYLFFLIYIAARLIIFRRRESLL